MDKFVSFKELCEELEKCDIEVKCYIGLDTKSKNIIDNNFIIIDLDEDVPTYADDSIYTCATSLTINVYSADMKVFNEINKHVRNVLNVKGQYGTDDMYYRSTFDVELFIKDLQ